MKALEKTGKALHEITVETVCSYHGDPNRLPASVFDQPPSLIHVMSTMLQLTLENKAPQNIYMTGPGIRVYSINHYQLPRVSDSCTLN